MPRLLQPSASGPARWARCSIVPRRHCERSWVVRHLSDGTLRRLYDEPLALSAAEREHYMACEACRAREATIAAAVRQVAHGLATPPVRVDTARAFTTLQRR